MRSIDELVNLTEPAWPGLVAEVNACPGAEVLPVDEEAGRRCLHAIQVTTRSRLGAMALHCGGLVFDHGWLRVYGGGSSQRNLPSLAEANGLTGTDPGVLAGFFVGHDVIGGSFRLNGPNADHPGEISYFAPDTLEWEPLGMGYGAWLSWLAGGATAEFYPSLRWPGWEAETASLRLDQGFSIYPFLCTAQAKENLAATSRKPCPIDEVLSFQEDLAQQLQDIPDGGDFVVRVTD
jgi:hypothetical protein